MTLSVVYDDDVVVLLLVENVPFGSSIIFSSCRFVVLISAPELISRVALVKARVLLEHALRRSRFEHAFSFCDGVFLRNVTQKMCVVAAESERAELETEAFEFFECWGLS